jgi:hypothetical protein
MAKHPKMTPFQPSFLFQEASPRVMDYNYMTAQWTPDTFYGGLSVISGTRRYPRNTHYQLGPKGPRRVPSAYVSGHGMERASPNLTARALPILWPSIENTGNYYRNNVAPNNIPYPEPHNYLKPAGGWLDYRNDGGVLGAVSDTVSKLLSRASARRSRTVVGTGGYIYKQYSDGSIAVQAGPALVGTTITQSSDSRRWNAITREIGTWSDYVSGRVTNVAQAVTQAAQSTPSRSRSTAVAPSAEGQSSGRGRLAALGVGAVASYVLLAGSAGFLIYALTRK